VKRSIAIVSPFLDKRHGTERCVAEQAERLARDFGYEVHIYAQRVEDVEGVTLERKAPAAGLIYHQVPAVGGPHMLNYVWWFAANQIQRWFDRAFRGASYDLVYTPGINCFDADVSSVHIVFSEFRRRLSRRLALGGNPLRAWPRMLHRRVYYALLAALERLIYPRRRLRVAAVSRRIAGDLARHYSRREDVPVIYHGVDLARFRPDALRSRRETARTALGLTSGDVTLLLVGNDWKNKGLDTLLDALASLKRPELRLLVVGADDRSPFEPRIRDLGLETTLSFHPPRPDVEFYYAAADICVAPSLEDAFALPPAEAMACGVPAIVSSRAGASEWITDGVDGLILRDPEDAAELGGAIVRLADWPQLREQMGARAAARVGEFTWDRNTAELAAIFDEVLTAREAQTEPQHVH